MPMDPEKLYFEAIRNEDDTPAVERYLHAQGDPDSKTSGGCPLLVGAAQWGRLKTAQVLVEAGASLELQGSTGWTALIAAAAFGHLAMVQYLLGVGADPRAVDSEGKSAKQYAEDPVVFKTDAHAQIAALLAAPPPPAAAAAPAPQPERPQIPEAVTPAASPLQQLCALGYAREEASVALATCGGNLAQAVQALEKTVQHEEKARAAAAEARADSLARLAAQAGAQQAESLALLASQTDAQQAASATAAGAAAAAEPEPAAVDPFVSIRDSFMAMKLSALKKWLRGTGVSEDQMDELGDASDPKAAAVDLILRMHAPGGGAAVSAAQVAEPEPDSTGDSVESHGQAVSTMQPGDEFDFV